MSYPRNKRERFLIGKRKGKKRSDLYWGNYNYFNIFPDSVFKKRSREEFIKRGRQLRRNTTKLCSCVICGNNPRRYSGELTLQERRHCEWLGMVPGRSHKPSIKVRFFGSQP